MCRPHGYRKLWGTCELYVHVTQSAETSENEEDVCPMTVVVFPPEGPTTWSDQVSLGLAARAVRESAFYALETISLHDSIIRKPNGAGDTVRRAPFPVPDPGEAVGSNMRRLFAVFPLSYPGCPRIRSSAGS